MRMCLPKTKSSLRLQDWQFMYKTKEGTIISVLHYSDHTWNILCLSHMQRMAALNLGFLEMLKDLQMHSLQSCRVKIELFLHDRTFTRKRS